eukprot:TRINITY_DN93_c2_g1_i1.p1 TRINITY_DN93_c2_g1~~TRINITY_DN93_c2_g1_i1.p1  ORF type:complete len:210 (+),score=-30.23 TRINITY_DN93_c2_g1_i1:239-868(+)
MQIQYQIHQIVRNVIVLINYNPRLILQHSLNTISSFYSIILQSQLYKNPHNILLSIYSYILQYYKQRAYTYYIVYEYLQDTPSHSSKTVQQYQQLFLLQLGQQQNFSQQVCQKNSRYIRYFKDLASSKIFLYVTRDYLCFLSQNSHILDSVRHTAKSLHLKHMFLLLQISKIISLPTQFQLYLLKLFTPQSLSLPIQQTSTLQQLIDAQ